MTLRAAVLTVLAGAALAVPTAPAAAAACTQDSGVTVLVDFASLGGGTQTRCASGDPASGLAALREAGFTPTRAAQEPGYFLCRINDKPANDPCQRTSPADAYWSYWHARAGGSWIYSSVGPADYQPVRGTIEGWAFGAGKPPSSPPPRQAITPRTPSPSPAASRAPSAAPTAVRTAPAASAAAASVAAGADIVVHSPTSSSAVASSASGPTATTAHAESPPGTVKSRPNKYAGPVAAAVLVLLIVAAGARRLRIRRREDGD